jgi:hypothetical protein
MHKQTAASNARLPREPRRCQNAVKTRCGAVVRTEPKRLILQASDFASFAFYMAPRAGFAHVDFIDEISLEQVFTSVLTSKIRNCQRTGADIAPVSFRRTRQSWVLIPTVMLG